MKIIKRIVLGLVILIVLAIAVVWVFINPIAKSAVESGASETLGVQTSLESIKINPLSGCLPMALQMPIWIALYAGLNTAVELRHAPFFWWINNLAGADNITAYFAGGIPTEPITKLPIRGPIWGLNILPILLGVAFFLQQKFMPSAGAATSPQAAQTKKMMYFMMAIFPLMLYSAPSGLNLYIMASTFAGIMEQYVIRKHIREKESRESVGLVSATSKTGGKVKKKKVKPPYNF